MGFGEWRDTTPKIILMSELLIPQGCLVGYTAGILNVLYGNITKENLTISTESFFFLSSTQTRFTMETHH